MRIATGFWASAMILIAASAVGLVGPWGLSAGAFLLLVAAVVAAMVMESRDLGIRPKDKRPTRTNVLRRAA